MVSDSVIRSRASRHQQKSKPKEELALVSIDEELKNITVDLMESIQGLTNLKVHVKSSLSNPVLQTLLLVLKKRFPDMCNKCCKKFIKNTDMFTFKSSEENSVPELMASEVGSHLVEQVITIITEKTYQKLFTNNLQGHLVSLALHPIANFVLQRLISSCPTEDVFENIFKELTPHIEDIMALNHMGIILRLAEASLRLGSKQEKLVKHLMKAFHCYKPEERQIKFVPLVAELATYEIYHQISTNKEDTEKDSDDSDSEEKTNEEEIVNKAIPLLKKVNLHGSILLQQLLKFGNPRLVVSSLLALKPIELLKISCDPCGSHMMDAFFRSSTVGEKNSEAMINRLKGFYAELSCSVHGSRTMDTVWEVCPLKLKYNIAEELAKQKNKLSGDKFGSFVFRKCAIDHFINRKEDWKDLQTANAKKRKLFNDIITDDTHKKKKIKKATGAK